MIDYRPIRILFEIGDIKIYSWGFMFFLAFMISFLFFYKKARKVMSEEKIYNFVLFLFLGILFGSRLTYVILNLKEFSNLLSFFYFWDGGMVSYGGIIGGLIFSYIYTKRKKINFWKLADIASPYFALGLAIGRIGCFLNWDDYGIVSSLPWAIKVANDIPRHPTQIYLSALNLIIFIILIKLDSLKNPNKNLGLFKREGTIFLLFLILYSLVRFFIDFIRSHPTSQYIFYLSVHQIFFVVLFFVSLFFFYNKIKEKVK